MKKRGPVFESAFNPLGMVIVAILGSFLLAEEMYAGRSESFSPTHEPIISAISRSLNYGICFAR